MSETRGRRRVALVLSCSLGIGGCGTLQVYSPARDAQGKAAQASQDAANKTALGVVAVRRDNIMSSYATLVEGQQASFELARDADMMRFAGANEGTEYDIRDAFGKMVTVRGRTIRTGLISPVNEQLAKMLGPDKPGEATVAPLHPNINGVLPPLPVTQTDSRLAAISNALSAVEIHQEKLKRYGLALREIGGPTGLSCEKFDAVFAASDKWLSELKQKSRLIWEKASAAFASYSAECSGKQGVGQALADVFDLIEFDGRPLFPPNTSAATLRIDINEYVKSLAAHEKRKAELSVERAELLSAMAEYRAALRAATNPPAPASEDVAATPTAPTGPASAAAEALTPPQTKLQQAAAKLQERVKKLKASADKWSVNLLSEETSKGIDEFLGSLVTPKDPSDPAATDRDKAAFSVVSLFQIEEAWQASQIKIDEIGSRPLQMIQELEAIRTAATRKLIAADELTLELLLERVKLKVKTCEEFRAAQRRFAGDGGIRNIDQYLQDVLSAAPKTDKERHANMAERKKILLASGHYWYGRSSVLPQVAALDAKLVTLERMRSVDVAEASVREWDVLVRTQVDLIAAWARSGVSWDSISKAVNSLLLLWISYKV